MSIDGKNYFWELTRHNTDSSVTKIPPSKSLLTKQWAGFHYAKHQNTSLLNWAQVNNDKRSLATTPATQWYNKELQCPIAGEYMKEQHLRSWSHTCKSHLHLQLR